MKTALILLLSAAVVSSKEKRGTEYYSNPQRPYSFAHFSQELPASEGLLRLLPNTYQKATPQQLAIVPVYFEKSIPVPVQQIPLISKVPLVYQYHGESKPNTFPHLRPYYKQHDQEGP